MLEEGEGAVGVLERVGEGVRKGVGGGVGEGVIGVGGDGGVGVVLVGEGEGVGKGVGEGVGEGILEVVGDGVVEGIGDGVGKGVGYSVVEGMLVMGEGGIEVEVVLDEEYVEVGQTEDVDSDKNKFVVLRSFFRELLKNLKLQNFQWEQQFI